MIDASAWEVAYGVVPAKLVARIRVLPNGCWEWIGTIGTWGYGQFVWRGKTFRAHRLVFRAVRGYDAPKGALVPDHTCRFKPCVNPDHLEPVTSRINTLRGVGPAALNAVKTHCKRGHPLEGENLRTKRGPYGPLRVCRTCAKAEAQARYELFRSMHPAETREVHWQGRKSTDCPACAAFLEVSKCA